VCDVVSTTCREPTSCEQAGCAQYQLCDQPAGADATCLADCEDGFGFDGEGCVPTPSCDADAPGFVDCGNRVCTELAGAVDCGDCLPGLVESDGECKENNCETLCGSNVVCEGEDAGPIDCETSLCEEGFVPDPIGDGCIEWRTCADLSCGANEYCLESTPTRAAECLVASPCGAKEVATSDGSCATCSNCFDDGEGAPALPGVTGVGNAGYAEGAICVCDLEDGWFQSIDGEVKRCDNDGDGWANADILPVLRLEGGNNPFAREQRCGIRRVDRFELRSDDWRPGLETAESRQVSVEEVATRLGLLGTNAVLSDPAGRLYVELIEPESLDVPDALDRRYTTLQPGLRLREYGDVEPEPTDGGPSPSPRFTAAEVNPLTKACNHDDDDLNLDGVRDVSQFQGAYPSDAVAGVLDALPVFYGMAYFLELNHSWYEPEVGTPFGKYVIAERKRVSEPDDPLALGLVGPQQEGTGYWRECRRSRRASFSMTEKTINHDFGLWGECVSDEGACEVLAGGIAYDGRVLHTENLRDAGPDLGPGGEAVFPGMNHSSQFACRSLDEVPAEERHRRRAEGEVQQFCRRMASSAGGGNPASADIDCGRSGSPNVDGFNYWMASGRGPYLTPAQYSGGCVDESVEWSRLCLVDSATTAPEEFGRLACGCGRYRGGSNCEVICTPLETISSREAVRADAGPDLGFIFTERGRWACAGTDEMAASLTGGSFTLRGTTRATPGPESTLCEGAGTPSACDTGFKLSPLPPRGTP
jgi:hypothetical protein